jgi:hypothetical protein
MYLALYIYGWDRTWLSSAHIYNTKIRPRQWNHQYSTWWNRFICHGLLNIDVSTAARLANCSPFAPDVLPRFSPRYGILLLCCVRTLPSSFRVSESTKNYDVLLFNLILKLQLTTFETLCQAYISKLDIPCSTNISILPQRANKDVIWRLRNLIDLPWIAF